MFSAFFKPNIEKLKAERNAKGLIKALQNQDSSIRGKAAEALGEIGSQETFGPLIAALNDPHHYPAKSAFRALLKLGKADHKEVYSALSAASQEHLEEFLFCGEEAIRVLRASGAKIPLEKLIYHYEEDMGQIGDWIASFGETAVDELLNNLENLQDWGDGHEEIAILLGQLGDKRAVRPLIKLLQHERFAVRQAAAESLGLLANQSAIEPLKRLLKDDYESVIKSAHASLKKIGWEPATDDERMRLALVNKDAIAFEKIGLKAIEFLKSIVRKGSSPNRDFAASFLEKKDLRILREAWDWDRKLQHSKNKLQDSRHIDAVEKYLLYHVLADIEHFQDHTIFIVTGLRWLPEYPSIVEALVPGLNVYTWSGVIGQKGVDEKLAELGGEVQSHPEERYLIWGPGSSGLLNFIEQLGLRPKVYYGEKWL